MSTKLRSPEYSSLNNYHRNLIVKEKISNTFKEERWEIINLIFFELEHINRVDLIQEINTKLIDNNNINQVILETLSDIDDYVLNGLVEKIEYYLDIDWLKEILT